MVSDQLTRQKTPFPLIDSLLLIPKEGKNGVIGICTNTTSSGQVLNEIDAKYRSGVAVLGTLIVSRDGTERMILNTLAHPTLKYLVLFSEESLTFSPSTNLLLAIQHGFAKDKSGNYIQNGVAAAAQYPNLSQKILDYFRTETVVLPLFMYKNSFSKNVIADYLRWLAPQIPKELSETLRHLNAKEKIYYDSLNMLLAVLEKYPPSPKTPIELDVKDFQHLQPPTVELSEPGRRIPCPFRVTRESTTVRVDLTVDGETYTIRGSDEFTIAYSIMKFLDKRKNFLTLIEQLFLGAELGRIKTEIISGLQFPSLIKENTISGGKELELVSSTPLETDKKYYYKIAVKGERISVMCMAFDVCEEVFELLSDDAGALLARLASQNRFEDYRMDILHRMDIGTQIGRAAIAAANGYIFIQDFSTIFKLNTTKLPFIVSDGDSFLDIHKGVLMKTYAEGITTEHGDNWKGPARSAIALAVYRDAGKALENMPKIYQQGESSTGQMRSAYKAQLLRLDHDGSYSYGERTRAYFGFDQLEALIEALKKNPGCGTIIQRYDPAHDMEMQTDPATGRIKFSHDPCLTHDIFFVSDKRLYSFHIARAHNIVNAYPENIFGLFDAYATTIRTALGCESGDMFMLSNRANILLLTEEQRTKKILGEPSKPPHDTNITIGPHVLGKNRARIDMPIGIAYATGPIEALREKPASRVLEQIENYTSCNTLERAITYLAKKGAMHNNAVLSAYRPGNSDPQGEHLIFFQANVIGNAVHATGVYVNHSLSSFAADRDLIRYLATRYSDALGFGLGNYTLFYAPFIN